MSTIKEIASESAHWKYPSSAEPTTMLLCVQKIDQPRYQFRQDWIDLVRGFAVILMIINHSIHSILGQSINQLSVVVAETISSFAPVVFFFTTGLGYGIQQSKCGQSPIFASLKSVFPKALVLLTADWLMFASAEIPIGLNFLGFIAISMLALTPLRHAKRPLLYSLFAFAVVFIVRFLVGPLLNKVMHEDVPLVLRFVTGAEGIPGVSYPIGPWLAFPFLGFTLGSILKSEQIKFIQSTKGLFVFSIILGTLFAIAGFLLTRSGFIFFRWGTMSAAYFVCSIGCVFLVVAISNILCGRRSNHNQTSLFVRIFSIRGIACLAVVPIHYFILSRFKSNGFSADSLLIFWAITLGVILGSMYAGKLLDLAISFMNVHIPIRITCTIALIGALVCSAILLTKASTVFDSTFYVCLGQISLCVVLGSISVDKRVVRNPA